MKKFLSLVLALVMTMSLVVVGASASDKFSDASSIKYPEAVDVVAACKIIDGYADGSFKGTDTLTRGAAAKIICNMVLGPTTASALGADVKPFPDVATNHTFAGYIAYCAQQGIINGYADGNFYPAKTVTGYQFMKMLLGALGYDGKLEGYTGGNWSVNVAKTALGIGLDDGNDGFVGTAAMTREEACLYAFNTLKADLVEYDNNLIITDGQLATSSKAKSMTYAEAGISKTVATQIVNDEIAQFGEKYFKDLKLVINDDNSDDFGRPATEWKYKSETVGTYADSDKLLKSYTSDPAVSDLYDLVGKSVYDDLTNSKTTTGDLTVYVDGKNVTNDITVANYFVKNSSASAKYTGKGILTEVYLDDDTNDVTIVIINTYLLQADDDYNSSKETLSVSTIDYNNDVKDGAQTFEVPVLPTTIDQDDFNVSDYKEDDYILVTAATSSDGTAAYEIKSVAKATLTTGEVSTYTTEKDVTIDGTKYKYNANVGKQGDGMDEKASSFEIGQKATVVMDAYGYVIHVDEATVAADSFVFIRTAARNTTGLISSTVKADAYFLDGTYKEITLNKVYDGTAKKYVKATSLDNPEALSGWYTYTVSGDTYTLKNVNDETNYSSDSDSAYTTEKDTPVTLVTNGKVQFMDGVRGNSETVFLTLDSDDNVDVYTGIAKVPTIKTGKAVGDAEHQITVTYVLKSGYAKYVFIDMRNVAGATTEDAETTSDYTLVLKKGSKINVASDDSYYTYEALVNGEVTKDLKTEDSAPLTAGVLYRSLKNGTKYISGGTEVDTTYYGIEDSKKEFNLPLTGAFVSEKSGTVSFAANEGNQDFVLTSDAKVYLVVTDGAKALLKDADADYEIYTGIKTLVSTLKGYAVDATVYGVRTDADSTCETLNTLYVYVEDAADYVETSGVAEIAAKNDDYAKAPAGVYTGTGSVIETALVVTDAEDADAQLVFRFVGAAKAQIYTLTLYKADGATVYSEAANLATVNTPTNYHQFYIDAANGAVNIGSTTFAGALPSGTYSYRIVGASAGLVQSGTFTYTI